MVRIACLILAYFVDGFGCSRSVSPCLGRPSPYKSHSQRPRRAGAALSRFSCRMAFSELKSPEPTTQGPLCRGEAEL